MLYSEITTFGISKKKKKKKKKKKIYIYIYMCVCVCVSGTKRNHDNHVSREVTDRQNSVPGVCNYGHVPLSLLWNTVIRTGQEQKQKGY